MLIAWIAIFGAVGTLCRFGVSRLLPAVGGLPLSSLWVNMAGSFAVGLLWGNALHNENPSDFRLAATVGFLGGFTTFSAFSLEVVRLMAQQKYAPAFIYAVGSPVACIALAAAGAWITSSLAPR